MKEKVITVVAPVEVAAIEYQKKVTVIKIEWFENRLPKSQKGRGSLWPTTARRKSCKRKCTGLTHCSKILLGK